MADTTTAQALSPAAPQSNLPAGLSAIQTTVDISESGAKEFANVDMDNGNDANMDIEGLNAEDGDEDEEQEEEDEDDGDDGAIGEISDRVEEDDDDADEDDEEEEDKVKAEEMSISNAHRISNGLANESRKRRDSHDVAFDAELDPDLYGLRRSVSEGSHVIQ